MDILKDIGIKYIEKVKIQYPKIVDRTIPLSATGISAWTFHDWKKKGLIPFKFQKDNDRVKLNLIEFSWIKVIESLRQFGVPFSELEKTKELLYNYKVFQKIIKEVSKDLDSESLKSYYSLKEREKLKNSFSFLNENIDFNSPNDQQLLTLFSSTLLNILITGEEGYFFVFKSKNNNELLFACLLHNAIEKIPIETNPYSFDHIRIPLKPIIAKLLLDSDLEKYGYSLGLLNSDEQTVINAIRSRNYSEINILLHDKEKLVIKGTIEKNVNDEKAKAIQKIFGLNEHDEVTIKFRKRNELYIKNKRKLI